MNYMVFLLVISVAIGSLESVAKGANILIYPGSAGGSHLSSASFLGKELVRRGHRVTFLVSVKQAHEAGNPRFAESTFVLHNVSRAYESLASKYAHFVAMSFNIGQTQATYRLYEWGVRQTIEHCRCLLHDSMEDLRKAELDLVIFDMTLGQCATVVAAKLGVKYMGLSLLATPPFVAHFSMGNPFLPSIMPLSMSGLPHRMTFTQRVRNMLSLMISQGVLAPGYIRDLNKMLRETGISEERFPDVLRNIELVLSNTHPAVDYPFHGTPNIISVGGLSTRPAQALEKDLEDFVQSSGDHGLVIFTLGSYLSVVIPDIVRVFVDVFAEIEQKVVWHIDDSEFDIHDITMPRHNKTRLMIYQGGNNGLYEAIYHGVPLIVMPLMTDHSDTATRVLDRGIGQVIDVTVDFNKETILQCIREVIHNNTYRERAKRLSEIFRDQKVRPVEKAADWVEHVVSYGGGYLRPATHSLMYWQLIGLDVIAFFMLIGLTFVYVIYKILRMCGEWLYRIHQRPKLKHE
ncbi:UDP-glucuronosyltransferase 2B1-like [Diadema setosum]|uniref:UDP-glucuronosyltransferase 2B1-like n=1 Tax=Diadema setosum TaxID=31175 RepID=UPI003B3A6C8F